MTASIPLILKAIFIIINFNKNNKVPDIINFIKILLMLSVVLL